MNKRLSLVRDAFMNRIASPTEITYISDRSNWAVRSIADDLVHTLQQEHLTTARISTTHFGTRRTVLHFGSPYTYLFKNGVHTPHSSNRVVVSVFHVPPDDTRLEYLSRVASRIHKIHTPTSLTRDQLIGYGFPAEKISCIPLGVNRKVYTPRQENTHQRLRKKWNIPQNSFVIGSFQKDGHGWGDGKDPKLVKGPDLLVEAARQSAASVPLFVLLAGPSRGYVKEKLTQYRIPYYDLGYQNSRQAIAEAYHALDAYVISSRVEGGPLMLLEAWASGVPLISTNVGMVADIGQPSRNVLLTEPTSDSIATALMTLHAREDLQRNLAKAGLATTEQYDWRRIAHRYYAELYQR